MKITERFAPNIGIPDLEEKVISDIKSALNSVKTSEGKFIVNDTEWYWKNPAGRLMRTVVNSASFITSVFQSSLGELGWSKEKTINNQTFDGYLEVDVSRDLWFCTSVPFLELLGNIEKSTSASSGKFATEFYERFYVNGSSTLKGIPDVLSKNFSQTRKNGSFRIGLEFETGNIASSFRAITKLENLFRSRKIDAGVFVTSINKQDCAARIWPSSNRNGSFEELDNRNFRDELTIPLWEVGFAPDGFDRAASYLAENGALYQMKKTDRKITTAQGEFNVFLDYKGQEKLSACS